MKQIKSGDILLIIIIFITIRFFSSGSIYKNGDVIIVTANGVSHRYLQSEEQIIEVSGLLGSAVIEIKDGKVHFIDSECLDKLCVKSGNLVSAPIICMPNAVAIYFGNLQDDKGRTIDAVVQ